MKRVLGLALVITFAVLLTSNSYGAIPKAGATCTKVGVNSTYAGIKYICVKSGKKMVWNKQAKVTTSTPIPGNPAVQKASNSCKATNRSIVKIEGGVLFCVPVSDGTYKYIEHFNEAPEIKNPPSPEAIEACQAPDLRGTISFPMSVLRIAHDSVVRPDGIQTGLLKHSGNLNIVVVPIDFSDARGTNDPESVYRKDFDTMTKWFADYSNGKLQMVIDIKNKWFRAPLPAANYDPTGWQTDYQQTTQKLAQDYINLTSSQVDYTKADAVVFVYPKVAFTSTGYLQLWNANFNAGKDSLSFSVLSSLGTADKYEPFWMWMSHELLHSMGLAMHSPADPPGWGVEWGRYSYSEALLPWNQMILDWINPDQYYCVTESNIVPTKITLVPQESSGSGLRTIFIRVSKSEVLMVVSYRKDTWSHDTPEDFYGTMVAIYDTTKQVDMSGEHIDDNFDGVKYQKPGIWLHPQNKVQDDNSWTNLHTGEGGALMYLGDVITYKGTRIKLVNSNNFDTLEISRS